MSAPTARRLVTIGSLSLALALAAPGAAFAEHKDGHEGDHGAKPTSSPSPAAQSGSSAEKGTTASPRPSKSAAKSSGKRSTPAERSTGKSGDPRGNNGTVKIDGEPFDSTPGNEPHVGCTFEVDFFGFDAGDTALVTLTGHAPTGGGELYSKRHTISTDAAGGGQDVDESIRFTAAQLGLTAITPHPQQGWHVKLAADVDSAPGGAKQKVFWVKCADVAPVSGTTSQPATGGAGGTTVTKTTVVDKPPLAPTFGAGGTTVASQGVAGRALTGTTTQAAGESTVSARSAARPSVLPFTGAEGIGYLLALGAAAVGVGTAAHRLGRRRATV